MLAFVACTVDAPPANKLDTSPDDKDAGKKKTDGGSGPQDVPDGADPPLPDGGKPPGRVFAHTKDTLYRYDPLANTMTLVGKFDCVPTTGTGSEDDSVLDIALDRTGQMYATTYYRFIKVDATSGHCTQVNATLMPVNQYPNSLSFVPMGTVDATQEALVGYSFDSLGDATIYTRIDLATGVMTDRQNLNPFPSVDGNEYGLAGDFISLVRDNAKTYAAIKVLTGDAGSGNNLLAEIDPNTGTMKKIIGDIGQVNLYGMGFWAGKAYGFSSSGKIYEIDIATGKSSLAFEAKDPNGVAIEWYGAGVTTDSPTAP
jgi:hypothetical protein